MYKYLYSDIDTCTHALYVSIVHCIASTYFVAHNTFSIHRLEKVVHCTPPF